MPKTRAQAKQPANEPPKIPRSHDLAGSPRASYTHSRKPQPTLRPTSEIVLTKELSLELVRTIITINISNIMCQRGIVKDKGLFAQRVLDPADPTCLTYDDFINGRKEGPLGYRPTADLLHFKILTRGVNTSVNKVLDWLERGVKEVLDKSCLSWLEFTFHRDDGAQVSDANLIESWSMAFTYGREGGVKEICSMKDSSLVSVQEAKQNAKDIIERIVSDTVAACKSMQKLPNSVRVNMNLQYNERRPLDYSAPGFGAHRYEGVTLNKPALPCPAGRIATGHHEIAVYPRVRTLIEEEQSRHSSNSFKQSSILECSPHYSSPSSVHLSKFGTQQEALDGFSKIGLSRNPRASTQDTQKLPEQSSIVATINSTPQCNFRTRRYKFSICKRIDEAKLHNQHESTPGKRVKCECGARVTHLMKMLICDMCGNSQHSQCYGYYDGKPEGIESVCYTCLLENDLNLLHRMKAVCVKRFILHHLCNDNEEKISGLSRILKHDEGTLYVILDIHLKDYLHSNQRSSIRGYTQLTIAQLDPTYKFVGDKVNMRREYFNPDDFINGYLQLPTEIPDSPLMTSVVTSYSTPSPAAHRLYQNLQGSSTQGTPSPRSERRQSSFHPLQPRLSAPKRNAAEELAQSTIPPKRLKSHLGFDSSRSPQTFSNY